MTDDRHDDLLRQILASHAETIVPEGDGLMKIQARTAGRTRSPWLLPVGALGTAAVVAGAFVLASQLTGDSKDSLKPVPLATQSSSPTSEPSSEPTPSTPPVATVAVPVYYLHDDGQNLRLYREFHKVQAPEGDRRKAAVVEMLAGAPQDPDYTSLWPKGTTLLGLTVNGTTAVVNLSKEAKQQSNAGSQGEPLSVQQLVYTVTAADPTVKKVELQVDGQKVTDLWGHGFGANPQGRAPQLDVQGFVWLLAPTQGATVGSPVTLSGIACTFEATVNIQIVQGSTVVKELNTMTDGGCPHFGKWSITVDLPPGDYLVKALEYSAKDGSPQYIDDKAVTVK